MQENNTNEDLPNFPFKNWDEFNKANADGLASLGIDRSFALKWTQQGLRVPEGLRLQVLLLMFLPFLSIIGFIIYISITKSWFLLPGLILFFLSFFLFSPSSKFTFGSIPSIFAGIGIAVCILSIIGDISWLTALTAPVILIWYGITEQYKKSVTGLRKALLTHEDLFILCWSSRGINVATNNSLYTTDKEFSQTIIKKQDKDFRATKNLVKVMFEMGKFEKMPSDEEIMEAVKKTPAKRQ